MSMATITAIQLVELVAAYLCMTVILPHLVLGKTLHLKNRYEKFIIYTVVGNFYAMSLVFILELIHLAYPIVIILLTIVPCAVIKVKLEKIPVKEILEAWADTLRRITGGQLKLRAYWDLKKPGRDAFFQRVRKHISEVYLKQITDVLLIAALIAMLFWFFGLTQLYQYGYKAFDLVVHNYWINELGENNIYCTGVYPYGFHCIVYYIECVFNMEVVTILRLLSWVELLWDVLIAFCVLKMVCKSKYIPYVGMYMFCAASFYRENTYQRYASALPQEYGIMFILPAIYALYCYIRQQRIEERGSIAKRSYLYLSVFVMSFSMTISVHFYGTMIAGLFCLAIAVGFCGWVFKKAYFKKILIAGVISIMIAVAPMAIKYATGTPLQQSLNWGLSVIEGTDVEEEKTPEEIEYEIRHKEYLETNKAAFYEKYGRGVGDIAYVALIVRDTVYNNVYDVDSQWIYALYIVLFMIPTVIVLGYLCIRIRRKDSMYGALLISAGVFWLFMCVLVASSALNIPEIMDTNRSSVYYTYLFGVIATLVIDSALYLYFDYNGRDRGLLNCASVICLVGCVVALVANGLIRNPLEVQGIELNDSMICLNQIMTNEDDFSWTIVSANDENRMANDSGYHYELYGFLDAMEYVGTKGRVRIPTEYVYVFVEKCPVDYYREGYDGSGQYISEEGSNNPLPRGSGLSVYRGRNRWVLMSRMDAWAKQFMKLYPNETNVFYETDDFVCYRIVQNPYRLFNFAIDYDYNTRTYQAVEYEEEKL